MTISGASVQGILLLINNNNNNVLFATLDVSPGCRTDFLGLQAFGEMGNVVCWGKLLKSDV